MATVKVWYEDGTTDAFGTEGGETWALAEELMDDPEVVQVQVG